MDTRSRKKELFDKLVAIKEKVNQKFQFVPNRFEQFECIPLDPTLDEQEKQAIIDKVDEKYFAHEKRFEAAIVLHQILVCLNEYFDDFLKENQLLSISDITEELKQAFKDMLPRQAQLFYTKIQRTQKYVTTIRLPSVEHLENFLRDNAKSFNDRLMAGQRLTLDDKDFQSRMEMYDQLIKVRERTHRQVIANPNTLRFFQKDLIEKLAKVALVCKGLFLSKEFTSVGFCDEHAALSLFYIMNEYLISIYGITVEKIGIQYTDEDDKEDDGHTFLAINRDPNSKLSDIASWGSDAILFDPWNKLICYATDYHTLPYHYVSFPPGAKWLVDAFYGQEDKLLAHGITNLAREYYMTGNSELAKRIPLVIEEFQLIDPLNENPLTAGYLYGLRDAMRPSDFDYDPELFLTTVGDEVFQLVPGFDVPKMAIHKDFTEFTEEELQFGMARALVMMQHHWAGMTNALSADEQFSINKLALEKSQNGPAAISFLRKSEEFRKRLEDESDKVELSVMAFRSAQPITHPDQIKALMTFFALDENHHLNTKEKEEKQTNITAPIVEEMKEVKAHVFFAEGLAKYKGKVAKIHYLTACLPDLKIELVPYELNDPSRRIRDFCHLLRSLKINLNNKKERGAVNTLLNIAHAERIPGFTEIYFAAHGFTYTRKMGRSSSHSLQPLGPFRKIQNEITKFVEAKSFEAARESALNIKKLRKEFACHVDRDFSMFRVGAHFYTEDFEKKNQGRPPTGKDRYYGSDVGKQVMLKGFVVKKDASLPWERHIEYAKNSLAIAYTLWDLGLRKYTSLWEVLPARDLLRLHKFRNHHVVNISGFNASTYGLGEYEATLKTILAFLNAQYPLRAHMFEEKIDFRIALKRFYYSNWRMLVYPEISDGVNYDNAAVKCLLDKFNRVALTGSTQDKQAIKNFFTAPNAQPGLRQLQTFEGRFSNTYLSVKSPYILFLLQCKLFTPQELANLFFSDHEYRWYVKYDKFSIPTYLKLYDLPFETITIECLETLSPLVQKHQLRISHFYVFLNDYFAKNSPHAFSRDVFRLLAIIGEHRSDPLVYLEYSKLQWGLPWDMADLNISLKELIYLYRYYDNGFRFPNTKFKHVLGAIIFKEIMISQDAKTQIERLEELLLLNEFSFPLTDIRLRNRVINQWVKSVLAYYGKDTGLADYHEKLIPVLKRVIKGAANRDIVILMEKLSVAIEAQWGVSEFIGERLESEISLIDKSWFSFKKSSKYSLRQTKI